ncbi:phage integrase family site specific recombinase [Citreicella sp. 357]|nr:phage integrase family site specific recombinase [Citreicella sp. 357]
MKLLKAADVKEFGIHGLRHYYVSLLVRRGKIKEASSLAGHASVSFTLDQYGHLIPGDQKTLDELSAIVADGMEV